MNKRSCAACRHLDPRIRRDRGDAYCWRFWRWVQADGTVPDCTGTERANGEPPPGQIRYAGERIR